MKEPDARALKNGVREAFADLRPVIERHFHALWEEPELPAMEWRAADLLCAWLEANGFQTSRGSGGLPTAFRAEAGTGDGPCIGILAEYDALPGLDNDTLPVRKPRGKAAGHACGHNQIGPANVGAAIAAARALSQAGVPGRIVVLGCPAEEILWGKTLMLERGLFDGCDALLTSHADYQNGILSRPCQSVAQGEMIFYGVAGHAGSVRRQNALDAAELAVQSIERLRAHNFPDTIVEHVLRVAGVHPGITPDESRIWLSSRQQDFERVWEVYEFAVGVCRRAAEMTGTSFRHQFIAASRGYLPNDTLADALFRSQQQVGAPRWTREGLDWMRELALACAPRDQFFLDQEIGLHKEGIDPYGQDDGEVSWRIPLARVNWAVPRQVPLHHWALSALSGHPASYPGPIMASEVLALGAVELIASPDIVSLAKEELARRVDGKVLTAPRVGAKRTLVENPQSFWDRSWIED
jgi:aminobenzoyl-glutamate utilization protein B